MNFEKKYKYKVTMLKGMMDKYGLEATGGDANLNAFHNLEVSNSDLDAAGPSNKDYGKLNDNSAISANITADPIM